MPFLDDVGNGRPHKLDVNNRALLFLVWLKAYLPFYLLAALFDVSETVISSTFSEMIPIFWRYCRSTIRWPSDVKCVQVLNAQWWTRMANIIGLFIAQTRTKLLTALTIEDKMYIEQLFSWVYGT